MGCKATFPGVGVREGRNTHFTTSTFTLQPVHSLYNQRNRIHFGSSLWIRTHTHTAPTFILVMASKSRALLSLRLSDGSQLYANTLESAELVMQHVTAFCKISAFSSTLSNVSLVANSLASNETNCQHQLPCIRKRTCSIFPMAAIWKIRWLHLIPKWSKSWLAWLCSWGTTQLMFPYLFAATPLVYLCQALCPTLSLAIIQNPRHI